MKFRSVMTTFFMFFYRRILVAIICCVYLWFSGLTQMILVNVVNLTYVVVMLLPCCSVYDSKVNYLINILLEICVACFFAGTIPMHYYTDSSYKIGTSIIYVVTGL